MNKRTKKRKDARLLELLDQRIEQRRKELESLSVTSMADQDIQQMKEGQIVLPQIDTTDIINIDSLICRSLSIAKENYSDNAGHLLKILEGIPMMVESLLIAKGIRVVRSQHGDEFDDCRMVCDEVFQPTDDDHLSGCIHSSIVPAFMRADTKMPVEKQIIENEIVKLYDK